MGPSSFTLCEAIESGFQSISRAALQFMFKRCNCLYFEIDSLAGTLWSTAVACAKSSNIDDCAIVAAQLIYVWWQANSMSYGRCLVFVRLNLHIYVIRRTVSDLTLSYIIGIESGSFHRKSFRQTSFHWKTFNLKVSLLRTVPHKWSVSKAFYYLIKLFTYWIKKRI